MSTSLNWTISLENLKELAEVLRQRSDDNSEFFLDVLQEFFEEQMHKSTTQCQKVSFYDMDSYS